MPDLTSVNLQFRVGRNTNERLCYNFIKTSLQRYVTMRFTRITINPNQMGGVPCIRGLRIPVSVIVGMVAEGMSEEEILKAYPDLELEDIREALRYAAEAVRERELPLSV